VLTGFLTLFVVAVWLVIVHGKRRSFTKHLETESDDEKRISGGQNVKKNRRKVNARFEYDAEDTKMLDKYISTLSTTVSTAASNGAQTTDSTTIPLIAAINLPPVLSNGTVTSTLNSAQPTASTLSAVSNNSPPSHPPSTNNPTPNSAGLSPQKRVASGSLTDEARARLKELEAKEREERARVQREQQASILKQQMRKRDVAASGGGGGGGGSRQGYN
jgi:hypothetical protein